MARPPRAVTASTRHVGFRLTDEEIERLDQLVTEHGCSDRSALLRAWLECGGPSPQTNRKTPSTRTSRATSDENVSPVKIHPPTNPPANELESSSPSPSVRVETPSIMRELLAALHRAHDARLGLIPLPRVVCSMLRHAPLDDVHEALLRLAKHGTIELRPDDGSEFLSTNDVALCPRGPCDTVFSYARWTDTR